MDSLDLEFLTVKSHEILKDALHNLVPNGVETAAYFPERLERQDTSGRYTLKTTVNIMLGDFDFDATVIGFRQEMVLAIIKTLKLMAGCLRILQGKSPDMGR